MSASLCGFRSLIFELVARRRAGLVDGLTDPVITLLRLAKSVGPGVVMSLGPGQWL
jgi:hypothetical protein